MRDITRLIALAIIAFTITAIAVALDNPNIRDVVSRRLGLVASESTAVSGRMTDGADVVRVSRPHASTWLGLQGFPSQTLIRFPIPLVAGLLNGQVQLDLQSELVEQGDGLLRILVNGSERDAIVLERGARTYRLTYDLSARDLAAGAVVVTLSANGTTNSGQICPTNVTNLGAAIEVLPSSALALRFDKPQSNAASLAVLLPDPLNLDVSTAPAVAAWAAQWLSRQGVPAILAPGPGTTVLKVRDNGAPPISVDAGQTLTLAGTKGVMELAPLRGAELPASYAQQWPLRLEAITTDLLTHTFRGSSRWSLKYKLADLPGGSAPESIKVALRTSHLQEGNHWTLRVTLNGSLIHSANYAGDTDLLSSSIQLPLQLQGLSNEILISLIDNTPNQGICRAGPEAAAQLLPTSQLDASSSPVNDKQTLVKMLAGSSTVTIRSGDGLPTAEFLNGMLGLILPLNIEARFTPAERSAAIEPLDEERARSLLSGTMPEGVQTAFVLIPSSRARPDGIEVLRISRAAGAPAPRDIGPRALLVTW